MFYVPTKSSKIITGLSLSIPMLFFYLGYFFNHDRQLLPTGFIQYDNVSYIAYAKQYLDADSFHLFYSNPFNDSAYATIYFQPQTLIFALLLNFGIPAGWILIPFTVICSVICFLLITAIYDYLVPEKKFRLLNIWLFAWGGGLLTVAGVAAYSYLHPNSKFFDGIFILDPEHGWWGLNFGRSLFFTCEAYYHALFLGSIYSLLQKKWFRGFILLFLLSISHPFTGIELAGIVLTWCIVEFFGTKKEMPYWLLLAVFFVFCFHIYYYLLYLNQFPDHQSVSRQYKLTWGLRFYRMIPAYCIVGTLAIVSVYKASFLGFLQVRSNRLLVCWFLVAFSLANHDMFMKPMQPIHFTRGYVWTSLFLLGLPALLQLNNYLKTKFGNLVLVFFCLLFFSDNGLWITNHVYSKATRPGASYISGEQKQVLKLLNQESTNKTLLISSDETIAYLASVYTKAWPWYSHPYTTPFAKEKKTAQDKFFVNGELNKAWLNRQVIYVFLKTDTTAYLGLLKFPLEKIIKTNNYIIVKYKPLTNLRLN